MSESSIYRRIISGQSGLWALPVRGMLRGVGYGYTAAVVLRNRWYDRHDPSVTLPVPVLSVGNLTAGGTGKTPLVIDLVGRLEQMGRNPAVLSRGYKGGTVEPNDEERLIRRRCPSVVCLADPDRARAGEKAIERFGADVLVLDDGFQHRRLARTLDVVVVDATCPFGHGHVLPRGLLREPPQGLRRADVIILTRCDQVSRAALERLQGRLARLSPDATRLSSRHRVVGVKTLEGREWNGSPEGKRAALFAGIGHPVAFLTTVREMGIEVVGTKWFPDHHRYSSGDVAALQRQGAFPPHELLLTTEKDAVKLVDLPGVDKQGIAVVQVAIDFLGESGTIWQSILEETISNG